MNLFSKLLHLHSEERRQLEDFHTEIVANVLRNDPELTLAWLAHSGVSHQGPFDNLIVETQNRLDSINGVSDGRIDMVIQIIRGERHEIVFVESKIGSLEGDGQLQKYLEHLSAMKGMNRRSLVFITRDYEPKDDLSIEDVEFFPARWSDFYRFVSSRASRSDTIREMLAFMKENNMSQNNRFTTIDLLALTNHSRARSLMEATMGETIAETFHAITGSRQKASERQKWLGENSYIMNASATTDEAIQYQIGYWFPDEQPSDSPDVGMWIFASPSAPSLSTIANAMRQFSKSAKCGGKDWVHLKASESENEGIWCSKKLDGFLATENHVAAIVCWFEELLDSAAVFREQNPQLPWIARKGESSSV